MVGLLAWAVALAVAVPAVSAPERKGYFRPPCRSGGAALRDDGRIGFSVRCVRRHGHKFRFLLSRGDRRGKHVTISFFGEKPTMRGPGAVYRRGRCQRGGQALDCLGYADGRVALRGWLEVPDRWRCRSRITMSQGVPSRCDPGPGEACPAVAVVDVIFSGLPQGC